MIDKILTTDIRKCIYISYLTALKLFAKLSLKLVKINSFGKTLCLVLPRQRERFHRRFFYPLPDNDY